MVPRLTLGLATVGALALAIWFATHESEVPTVLGRYSTGYFLLLCGLFSVAALGALVQVPPVWRRVERGTRPLLAIAVSTAVALLLAEIMVRWFDPLGVSYYERANLYQQDRLPDPELGFRHRPDHRASYCGLEYAYNELGLRDRAIGAKAEGELRVLVLGDSVTLGSGVVEDRVFCRRLEELGSARLGRPVRVVNSGVGGYNTSQELAFLRRQGATIDPDVVLLVYVYNDIETHAHAFEPGRQQQLAGKSPPEVVQALCSRSWLYRLIVHSRRFAGGAAAARIEPGSVGWRESMTAVAEIADWAQRRSLPFATFYWRSLHDPATDDLLWRDLAALAQQRSFPLADVFVWFGGQDMRALTNSVIDSHPNAAGHELAARNMLEFLLTQGVLAR